MSKLILFLVFLNVAPLRADNARVVAEVRKSAVANDLLGTRILALRASKLTLEHQEWATIRALLHRHPGVGWDLLRYWDRLKVANYPPAAIAMQKRIEAADALMAGGQFAKSSAAFESSLRELKRTGIEFGDPNFYIYQTSLHSYARSLYGEGRYAESAQVYDWISILYPFLRQTQFEKMWAAFRANDVSLALGALASQRSSYFSSFLEPEAYLVQYYLYRRLCRVKDLAGVTRSVRAFKELLDTKKFSFALWMRRDMASIAIMSLIRQRTQRSASGMVSPRERLDHTKRLRKVMDEAYAKDLARLSADMEKVTAYINLAPEATKKELPLVYEIPQLHEILNSQTEMWKLGDAEDWLDELAAHHFLGASECH